MVLIIVILKIILYIVIWLVITYLVIWVGEGDVKDRYDLEGEIWRQHNQVMAKYYNEHKK
jgi:hypothetical protein